MKFTKEMFFPRSLNQQNGGLDLSSFETMVFVLGPFVVLAYLVSLGTISSLSDTFGGLLLLSGAALLWSNRKYSVVPSSIRVVYGIGLMLFAMVVLHALFGQNLEMLFNFQFENLRNMLLLPFIAMVAATIRLDAQGVWRLIVLAGTYTVFYSILLVIEQPIRGEGLLAKAIVLGNVAMMFSLLSLVAFFGLRGRSWRALAVIVFLSGLLLSLLTGTRAGWMAFIIAIIFLLWAFWSVNRTHFYIVVVGILIAFALTLIFWSDLPIEARFLQAVNDIELYLQGDSNTSVGARFDMWRIGLSAFWERPIFGWGVTPFQETFVHYVNQGVGNYKLSELNNGFAQPHNDYVFVLYHFGLVGFGLIMAFLLYPAWVFIKALRLAKVEQNSEKIYLALTGLVVLETLMDFMMFNLAFMNKIFYVFIVILFLTLFALNPAEKRVKNVS